MPLVTAKTALKVVAVLDPASLLEVACPEGQSRIILTIKLPAGTVSADLATKSLRRAKVVIREHGPDAVAATVQGKLDGNRIVEAGLVAQVKAKPVAAAA